MPGSPALPLLLKLKRFPAGAIVSQIHHDFWPQQLVVARDQPLISELEETSLQSLIPLNALTTLFAAVEEGFYKAEQYEALARKSDRELGALGLSHADLPHSVVFGKK